MKTDFSNMNPSNKSLAEIRQDAYREGYSDGAKASRKHGHWIIGKTAVHGYPTCTCSVCGQEITGTIRGKTEHIYMKGAIACPLCASLMDEVEDYKNDGN